MKNLIRFGLCFSVIVAIFFIASYKENSIEFSTLMNGLTICSVMFFASIFLSISKYKRIVFFTLAFLLVPLLFFAQSDSTSVNPDFSTIGGMDAAYAAIVSGLTIVWGYIARIFGLNLMKGKFVFVVLAGGLVIAGAFILGTSSGETFSDILPRSVLFIASVITGIGTHTTFINPFESRNFERKAISDSEKEGLRFENMLKHNQLIMSSIGLSVLYKAGLSENELELVTFGGTVYRWSKESDSGLFRLIEVESEKI